MVCDAGVFDEEHVIIDPQHPLGQRKCTQAGFGTGWF